MIRSVLHTLRSYVRRNRLEHDLDEEVRFHTMEIPILEGRAFTDQDAIGAPPVAVINMALARRFLPDENPIGRRITTGMDQTTREIVGVAGDIRHSGLNMEPEPELYISYYQSPWPSMTLLVRMATEPESMTPAIREAVLAVDPNQPIDRIRTMDAILADSTGSQRFLLFLFGLFAAVSLLLASVGIYAVMSYVVAQRTHEIGIRVALGAQRRNIFTGVFGQGMRLVMIGLVIGLAGVFAVSRIMSGILYEVGATDPATFAGSALLLMLVTLVACYIPARRATQMDPMRALKYE